MWDKKKETVKGNEWERKIKTVEGRECEWKERIRVDKKNRGKEREFNKSRKREMFQVWGIKAVRDSRKEKKNSVKEGR